MFLVKNLVILAIIIILIYGLVKNKINLFEVYLVTLPISFVIPIGLNFFIYHVIIITMILKKYFLNKKYFFDYTVSFFLVYFILITIIVPTYFTDSFVNTGYGFFRQEGRFVSQIVMMLLSFVVIPLSYYYVKTYKDIYKYLKIYIKAIIFYTILGWVQLIIFIASGGTDIFPLRELEDGSALTGKAMVGGSMFMRFGSICGEPKTLSVFLVTTFFIIHIFNSKGIKFFNYDGAIKFFLFISMFATLSTSGLVMFAVLYLFYLVYEMSRFYGKIKLKTLMSAFLLLTFFGELAVQYGDILIDIANTRIFERDLLNEDFDAPIKRLLMNEPQYLIFGTGGGNVHNLAAKYISPENMHYMQGTIFVAKSGYLKLISEFGVLGTLLFLLFNFKLYYNLGFKTNKVKYTKYEEKVNDAIKVIFLFMFLSFLMRVYAMNIYIFIMAFGFSILKIKKRFIKLYNEN